MRINKYIAQAGIASRRKADELIQNGNVKVNGAVLKEPGYEVKPGDKVVAVGSLIVIPDVSQLMRQGQPTEITRGSEGEEGVTGYGGLGVRTMMWGLRAIDM